MTTLNQQHRFGNTHSYANDGKSWSESALDWFLRAQQIQAQSSTPFDPSSAAWAFCRPSPNKKNGTKTTFVDNALMKHSGDIPILEVRGGHRTGKTATLLTLAARFVVDTRPSRFAAQEQNVSEQQQEEKELPQVVIFDSNLDITPSHLLCHVRTALLRQSSLDSTLSEDTLEQETILCMNRIHIVSSEDMGGWVPALESLRARLAPRATNHPTLLLWDNFMCNNSEVTERMEVIRQLNRLLRDCTILLITTTMPTRKGGLWDKYVTQRILLEHVGEHGHHKFCATVQNTKTPYSITAGGVLC